MAAIITINQVGSGPGSPGIARNDLWENQVTSLVASSAATYAWSLLSIPKASSAVLVTPTASTSTFTPDVVGTYRIRLVVNGGGTGNTQTLIARVRYDSSGVLKNRGWAYPAIGEQLGENSYSGNDRGWSGILEYIFEDIRTTLAGVTGVPTVVGTVGATGISQGSAVGISTDGSASLMYAVDASQDIGVGHTPYCMGFAATTVVSGASLTLLASGEINTIAGNWAIGSIPLVASSGLPVYVSTAGGANCGKLTITQPTSGWIVRVGSVTNAAGRISIQIERPVRIA